MGDQEEKQMVKTNGIRGFSCVYYFYKHNVAVEVYVMSMKEMCFDIKINAPKERVWQTLWSDETLRDWAGLIDPGTYMIGELKVGNKVQFISVGGYGVTSLVEELISGEFLLLKHQADTQDEGQRSRDDQWTGGKESYSLKHEDGVTTLTMAFDVPPELEQIMSDSYPKALRHIKELSEK